MSCQKPSRRHLRLRRFVGAAVFFVSPWKGLCSHGHVLNGFIGNYTMICVFFSDVYVSNTTWNSRDIEHTPK